MFKNTLIEYQGGGYDGCIWEWNYCYYDKEGNFHNIYASGCSGCETDKEMQDYLKVGHNVCGNDYYIYNLYDDENIKDFVSSSSLKNVFGIANWLAENQNIYLEGECSICENTVVLHDVHLGGFFGNGGINIEASEIYCNECWETKRCERCEEVIKDGLYDGNLCKECWEELCGEDDEED